MIYKGLPVYNATIPQDAEGMVICSLVSDAAVESDFLAFDENKKPLEFSVQDEEQRMVLGVVMKADYPIFRYHPEYGEFYVVYSADTIKTMVERFFNEHYVNSVDLEHSFELEEGVHLIQAFIKNESMGISPVGFEDCKDGSLFFQYHIENDEIWNAIKEGTYRGFSLAGTFGLEETFSKEINNNTNKEHKFMSKLEKIKQALRNLLVEYGEISTSGGVIIWDSDEELKIGDSVHTIDENGSDMPIEDGTYTTEDKKQIIVKDGRVEDIVDIDAEVSSDVPEQENPEEQENSEDDPALEPVEEPESEPETDDKDELIKQLQEQIAALEQENTELKDRIKELEETPAAPSASEEFEKINAVEDNSPAGKLRKRGYVLP